MRKKWWILAHILRTTALNKESAYLKILQYTITTATYMQAKYLKRFEQDGIVRTYLTDKEELKLEEALSGSSNCVNRVTYASMTLSNNDLFLIVGEHQYLRLKMVKGKYYEDLNLGVYMGTIWEGDFMIELADQLGNVISRMD